MTAAAPPPVPARATRREWIGLAVIALPCLVYAMDLTVLNLALPAISTELQPSAAQLLWIVDVYGFMVAGFLITMGTLGDRIGRRKLLLAGAAAFGAASVAAAFARSAEMLIVLRALLGIAGATLAPSTLSLIRNMFHDEHERQFAIGVWIASFSLGGAIGPLVGGVVLQWFHWGAVFLVAVPVMALLLLLGPLLLPEYKDPARRPARPGERGAVAGLGAVHDLRPQAPGRTRPPVARAGADRRWALRVGVLFVRRQRQLAYPLMDLKLFRQPRFSAAIAAYALSCVAMFGVYIFITQYLQLVLGLSPLVAGLATVPWSLCFVVGLAAGAAAGAQRAAAADPGGRPGHQRRGLRRARAGRRAACAGAADRQHGGDEPGHGPGDHHRQRDDHHRGTARARRRRVGAVGNQRRIRRRDGHRRVRQRRHRAVPRTR